MKECVLCKTRYQKGSWVTFHNTSQDMCTKFHDDLSSSFRVKRFPTDIRRLESWMKNIKKPSWRPKKYDYICSKHFSADCFIKHNACTTLKKCSIPTIFCSSAENVSSTHESMVLPTPSVYGTRMVTPALLVPGTIAVDVKRTLIMDPNITNLSAIVPDTEDQTIASKKARSKLESSPSTHEKMIAPTPSVSGKRMVTPTSSVSETIAADVKRTLIMDPNNTNLSGRKRRSTSCDPQQSIVSKKARPELESSPSTHVKLIAPTLSVSGSRMVTPKPSVSGTIAVRVKRRLIMEQNDTNLSCRRRQITSCDLRQSTPSKKFRSISEVCDNIKHDHRYEITPKSSKKALLRVKNSLRNSRVRVKALSQHVKRLKVSVSSLRTVISELSKKK